MVDPEAVVQQVWQQIVPTDWKIIRGRRRSAWARGVSAGVWTFAGLIVLVLVLVALNTWQHAAHAGRSVPALADVLAAGSIRLLGYPALAVVGVAVAALTILVGVVVLISAAIRNAGDPDPLLVLLPQGFVEYANRRKPIIGVPYADLARVVFKKQASRRARPWLELVYQDGSQERWRPRTDFGPSQRVFEAIIKARALYEVLYGGS